MHYACELLATLLPSVKLPVLPLHRGKCSAGSPPQCTFGNVKAIYLYPFLSLSAMTLCDLNHTAIPNISESCRQIVDDSFCLQEALEAEAERDMQGMGRSVSSMSFGDGSERQQLAHQFSGNIAPVGSAPALGNTGIYPRITYA